MFRYLGCDLKSEGHYLFLTFTYHFPSRESSSTKWNKEMDFPHNNLCPWSGFSWILFFFFLILKEYIHTGFSFWMHTVLRSLPLLSLCRISPFPRAQEHLLTSVLLKLLSLFPTGLCARALSLFLGKTQLLEATLPDREHCLGAILCLISKDTHTRPFPGEYVARSAHNPLCFFFFFGTPCLLESLTTVQRIFQQSSTFCLKMRHKCPLFLF